MQNTLGFYLRNKRLDKKMTIEKLSKKANISKTMIVAYEKGRAIPNIKGTEKLAKGLGMTYEQIRRAIVDFTDPDLPKGPEISD
jgi:transcriptional regulator with XRE-family HTH domain